MIIYERLSYYHFISEKLKENWKDATFWMYVSNKSSNKPEKMETSYSYFSGTFSKYMF